MTKVCDFLVVQARARLGTTGLKNLTDAAFRDKSLTKTAIYNYNILKKGKGPKKQLMISIT